MNKYWFSDKTMKLYVEMENGKLYDHDEIIGALQLCQDISAAVPIEDRQSLELKDFKNIGGDEKPV